LQQQPFDEIAAEWKLTKGRISQIHHSALKRLRVSLRPGGAAA
jgi:RNA polymerase sigma factor for flagellar operon FliA